MIDKINNERHDHIMTIETRSSSCIRTSSARQPARGLRRHAVVHQALKSILRQDPDVVLVGEMRDLETIARR